jgi:hypothetical protein
MMNQMTFNLDKEAQKKRILRKLQTQPSVTTVEFLQMYVPRFSARIYELKQQGHNIQREYWRDRMYKYRLVQEREYSDVD